MILTLFRLGWLNLKRDRVAQALTFLLPIVFFSIFASVFGSQGGGSGTPRIRLAVVDDDRSELSARILTALEAEPGLRVRKTTQPQGGSTLDRTGAERLVRNGDVPVAVVIPKGLGAAVAERGMAPGGPSVELLADVSDRIAPQMVLGLLQKVTMTAAPDLLMKGGLTQFEKYGGTFTPQQRAAVQQWMPMVQGGTARGGAAASGNATAMGLGVQVVDVMRPKDDRRGSLISFYAAGIGVMFLLFSCVGAAGAVLLEEVESGTLERVLSTNIGMTRLLFGKWIFLSLIGFIQLTIMFVWGRFVFGLPLFSHLAGFTVMTAVTSAAAAALGLVLASIARSRAQLGGFSTILILTMSALGGSMFPRFLMSETMQKFGLLTFNGWALDGYLKVFWRNAAVWELWPQVLVLVLLSLAFMSLARMFARRWETV